MRNFLAVLIALTQAGVAVAEDLDTSGKFVGGYQSFDTSGKYAGSYLCIPTAAGGVVYLAACRALRVRELATLLSLRGRRRQD